MQKKDHPVHEWKLTDEGRHRCQLLAERLAPYAPDIFVTSLEPKARLTGELTAQWMGKPVSTGKGLQEHERHAVGWFDNVDEFRAAVVKFFLQPDQLVFGEETANVCFARFAEAVEHIIEVYTPISPQSHVMKEARNRNIVIVSHGTVMALFIARLHALDPVELWKGFGMPAFVVLSLPDYEIVEIVNDVT